MLLEQRQAQSRRAQLTLASVKTDVNRLQGLPWQAENPHAGTPTELRGALAAGEQQIGAKLDRLLSDSPPASLPRASAALEANYAALDAVLSRGASPGGWKDPVATASVSQRQNASLTAALRLLGAAGSVYAERAAEGERACRIGAIGAIAALLAAFLFYFGRAERIRAALSRQATTDPLTGLANRLAFTDAVAGRLAAQSGAPVTVLFLDLDRFKAVNDVHGHHVGDAVLREAAARLARGTRDRDLCARLGGDEFAVALDSADMGLAESFARRVGVALAEPIALGDLTLSLGASIGIAAAPPGTDVDVLVHRADVAMYAAKSAGGGGIASFDPRMLDRRHAHRPAADGPLPSESTA